MKILRFVLGLALGILIPLAFQRWHRRRLTPAQREDAWNTASWGAALYAFGPLSLLGWAVVTRSIWPYRPAVRVAVSIAFGLALTAAAVLLVSAIDWLIATALGLPD
ncbi:hypothetical protein [Chondromyces apiculatus]|uniref:Uncharacterized protein n=1 Tax=Chondromyces apiculatus DSM 436 TaxID=1192034 RepID=A0A017TIX4_9BACT|nr:hypothetical protein [Chondromyces apiculatus]EYF08800.1 Hypothetical protein CAP_2661 [Chondromyces apiculatus DSM 436]